MTSQVPLSGLTIRTDTAYGWSRIYPAGHLVGGRSVIHGNGGQIVAREYISRVEAARRLWEARRAGRLYVR